MFKKHALSILLFFLVIILLRADEMRIIPVTLVAESNFCFQHIPWEWAGRNIIEETNLIFSEVGIVFKIEKMITINIPRKDKSTDLFYLAQNVIPPDNGIVILLSSRQYNGKVLFYEGLAYLNGRHCLISDNAQFLDEYQNLCKKTKKELEKLFAKMLAHEICHLLGIPHNEDPNALMHAKVKRSAKISKNTAKILKLSFQQK